MSLQRLLPEDQRGVLRSDLLLCDPSRAVLHVVGVVAAAEGVGNRGADLHDQGASVALRSGILGLRGCVNSRRRALLAWTCPGRVLDVDRKRSQSEVNETVNRTNGANPRRPLNLCHDRNHDLVVRQLTTLLPAAQMMNVMKMTNVMEVVEVVEVVEVPEDWDRAYDDAGDKVVGNYFYDLPQELQDCIHRINTPPNYFYDLPLDLQNYITGRFVYPPVLSQAIDQLAGCSALFGSEPADRSVAMQRFARILDYSDDQGAFAEHPVHPVPRQVKAQCAIDDLRNLEACLATTHAPQRDDPLPFDGDYGVFLLDSEYYTYEWYPEYDERHLLCRKYCHLDGGFRSQESAVAHPHKYRGWFLPDERYNERAAPGPSSRLEPAHTTV